MPVDPSAVGATSTPRLLTWTTDDTCLYALGVGAGVDDLAFTTENTLGVPQQALPTMATVLGPDVDVLDAAGDLDLADMVHAEQTVEVPTPLPPAGSVRVVTELAELWDKGHAALAVLVTTGHDVDSGELRYRAGVSIFIHGAGGFGGDRGPSRTSRIPQGAPATTVSYRTREDQALLYRLCGDHNPLHSDPAAAARAGYERPILHGRCTYGFAGRALIAARGDGDAGRLTSMRGRFVAPVLPGDLLHVDIWDLDGLASTSGGATPAGDGRDVAFQVRRNTGEVVLAHGEAHLRAS